MANIKKNLRSHVIKIIESFEEELMKNVKSPPMDLYLRRYLHTLKKIEPHDKGIITQTVYDLLKQQVFLDVITPKPVSWESRLDNLFTEKFYNQLKNPSFLLNVRCSCPKELWELMTAAYGEGKAFEYMKIMNEKAPLTVRANLQKNPRDELFDKWRKQYKFEVKKTDYSPVGITFTGSTKTNLFELPDYEQGLFEIQDEASQLVSLRVDCKPGDHVLDFCAGSGGKSLAFAPQMQGTGQLYLHDVRSKSLTEAKKRFNRAGITNVQFHSDMQKIKNLEGKMNWVLLDVPCTGTGTLRRNPDLKMKFNKDRLNYYVTLQQSIFKEAHRFMSKEGRLVYTTCSMLPQENLDQVVKFCKEYNLKIEDEKQFQSLPESNQMDSFYSVTLKRK